jgi:hypothetical protein
MSKVMNQKLIVNLDSKVIEKANKYADKKGTTLPQLIEQYLKRLIATSQTKMKKEGSIMELKGILGKKGLDNFNYKEEVYKYLLEKHK